MQHKEVVFKGNYLFTSQRPGFCSWAGDDLEEFAAMNVDPVEMRHFPTPLSRKESAEFLNRLQNHYSSHGYCYFAAETLETQELIGFIGLAYQTYNSKYAFEDLELEAVVSTCPRSNYSSERVMQKAGMKKMGEFDHPGLQEYPELQRCVWYQIKRH